MANTPSYLNDPQYQEIHERIKGMTHEEMDALVLESANELRASAGLSPLTKRPDSNRPWWEDAPKPDPEPRTWHFYYQRVVDAWAVLTGRDEAR